MKKILVLGAGKSTRALIEYLLARSEEKKWQITLGDLNVGLAKEKLGNHSNGKAIHFDVLDEEKRAEVIAEADIVASLLPAKFHILVARECLKHKKHLVTASYLTDECAALDQAFKDAGLLFMGEMGLDPGIDHMVMMEKLEQVRAISDSIEGIYSFTGALIAPESDNNPWHYKFTWAPMNVVLAGQGVSVYLNEGKKKYIPYDRLFTTRFSRTIEGLGDFEVYANRNSLPYLKKYKIEKIPTLLRGTMRWKGYCDAWNALVKLGLTDNSYQIDCAESTYADLTKSFVPIQKVTDLKAALALLLQVKEDSEVMRQLEWLGLLSDEKIPMSEATPAEILLELLQRKWVLAPDDKDMTVMMLEFDYTSNGKKEKLTSSMVFKGTDMDDTSIARLVGLPVGIMIRLVADEAISVRGVRIPTMKEVYEPVMKELAEYEVAFEDKTEALA